MNYFHLDFVYYVFFFVILLRLRTEKELGHIKAHSILMHYGSDQKIMKPWWSFFAYHSYLYTFTRSCIHSTYLKDFACDYKAFHFSTSYFCLNVKWKVWWETVSPFTRAMPLKSYQWEVAQQKNSRISLLRTGDCLSLDWHLMADQMW